MTPTQAFRDAANKYFPVLDRSSISTDTVEAFVRVRKDFKWPAGLVRDPSNVGPLPAWDREIKDYAGYNNRLQNCCGATELVNFAHFALAPTPGQLDSCERHLAGALLYIAVFTNKGIVKYYCPHTENTALGITLLKFGFKREATFFNRNTGNMVDEYTLHFGKEYN